MKAVAMSMAASQLKTGDLFSMAGPEYWDTALEGRSGAVGERVYIRTAASAENAGPDIQVYRITLE